MSTTGIGLTNAAQVEDCRRPLPIFVSRMLPPKPERVARKQRRMRLVWVRG